MQRNTYIAAWLCKTVFQVKMQDGENMYYIDKSIIRYCKLWTSSAGTYSLHLVFFIMISHVEVVPLIPNHLDFIGCWVIPGQVITKNGRTTSDFNKTWYIHTLSEVIDPQQFLASYVIWLLSYNLSKFNFEGNFQWTSDT